MTPKPVKCLNIGVAGRMNCRKSNRPRTLQPLVPPEMKGEKCCIEHCSIFFKL